MLLEWQQKKCFGRTPENLDAIRPLKDGVIADFTATKMMLKYFVDKACQRYVVARPRVVVCVPTGVTEVEERAVEEATLNAGAREAYLMEEPMAAAIGAGLKVGDPSGTMIVDIGGGTSEICVISLGGGAFENSETRNFLLKNSTVIFLKTSPKIIFERIKTNTLRPLLKNNMTVEKIVEILVRREKNYNTAQIAITTDNKLPNDIVEEIIGVLE